MDIKRFRWTDWLLAGCTLLLAGLLIWQCADTYRVGNAAEKLTETGVYIQNVYTLDGVVQRLSGIAWALWLWLAAFAAALLTGILQPAGQHSGELAPEVRLELMNAHRERTPEMDKVARRRMYACCLCCAVCLACAVPCVMYFVNLDHFASRDLEPVMGQLMLHVAPFVGVAFLALMVLAAYRAKSMEKETELAKKAPVKKEVKKEVRTAPVNVLRVALYVAAAGLIVTGILNGGMYDVLVKAVNICTECVGLG